MGTNYLRPDADDTDGNWINASGNNTDLYDSIADTEAPYTNTTSTSGSTANGNFTVLNRSSALTNGVTITKIGAYALSAMTIVVKLAKRNSAGNYTIEVSQSYSHGGTGWEDCTLTTPFEVPATGDYYVGHYSATARPYIGGLARTVVSGNATGTVTMTEDTSNVNCVRAIGTVPITRGRQAYSETTGAAVSANANFTILNRSFAVDNGVRVTSIGVYANSAATIVVKLAKRNSAGNYTIVISQSFSHTGSGWEDCTLSTPYDVPLTGDYYVGHYSTSARGYVGGTPRSTYSGDATGTVTMGEDTSNSAAVRVNGYSYPGDTDYIQSPENASNEAVKIRLGNPTVAVDENLPVKVQYRCWKSQNSGTHNLKVRLLENTTEIASWTHSDISVTPTVAEQTLTAPQVAAITSFDDLYLEFVANPVQVGAPTHGAHRYWRIYITALNNNVGAVSELEFWYNLSGSKIATTGGTPIASSTAFGSAANAFDGVEGGSNYWHPTSFSTPEWIGYDFGSGNTAEVGAVGILDRQDGQQGPSAFSLQYSDDGSSWTTAWSVSGVPFAAYKKYFTDPDGGFQHWRLRFQSSSANATRVAEWRMRETSGGSNIESEQFYTFISTATSGSAASMFDADNNTIWYSAFPAYPIYAIMYFNNQRSIGEFTLTGPPDNLPHAPENVYLDYSADGASWTNAYTNTSIGGWSASETKTFTL